MYINLDEAYLEFVTTNFPCYNERMVKVPVSFQFNIPVKDDTTKETKVIHGIVSEEEGRGEREKSKKEKDWYKAASGLRAEEKIFDKLQEQFSDNPCLLVNGFKEQDMIKVIKEKIKDIKGKGELSEQVKIFFHRTYFRSNHVIHTHVGIKLLQSSKQTF